MFNRSFKIESAIIPAVKRVQTLAWLTLIFFVGCSHELENRTAESFQVSDDMMDMIRLSEVRQAVNEEGQPSRSVVPVSSLVFDQNKNFVVVFHDRQHVEIRPVTLYHQTKEEVEICCDLKAGEKVITDYHLFIYTALSNQ